MTQDASQDSLSQAHKANGHLPKDAEWVKPSWSVGPPL